MFYRFLIKFLVCIKLLEYSKYKLWENIYLLFMKYSWPPVKLFKIALKNCLKSHFFLSLRNFTSNSTCENWYLIKNFLKIKCVKSLSLLLLNILTIVYTLCNGLIYLKDWKSYPIDWKNIWRIEYLSHGLILSYPSDYFY